jgi:hypothetical protein
MESNALASVERSEMGRYALARYNLVCQVFGGRISAFLHAEGMCLDRSEASNRRNPSQENFKLAVGLGAPQHFIRWRVVPAVKSADD